MRVIPQSLGPAAAFVALVAFSGACDPQPRFPETDPAVERLDAVVMLESEVVVGQTPIVASSAAIFEIPPDVAPPGTRFTLRILKTETLAPVDPAEVPWFVGGRKKIAVLVTPETISFTRPISLVISYFPNETPGGDVYVLHALSTDAAWTRGATLPSASPARIPIQGGGVWSIAYQPRARP